MKAGGSLWGSRSEAAQPAQRTVKQEELNELYSRIGNIHDQIFSEVGKVVAGQQEAIEQIMVAILTKNHALLEGFPGLGKTLMVNTISQIVDLKFKRVQCTPDLMPSDITGTYLVEEEDGKKKLRFEPGPVFTNILLADEINRATPKTQSALLEAMQERQVTVGNCTYPMDNPFFVLATQNPIEMEGTYPLPEAQVDRFQLKIIVKYPEPKDEEKIIDLYTSGAHPEVRKILSREQLLNLQELTKMMPISNDIKKYALDIVQKSRPAVNKTAKELLDYGASPRASISLILAGKAKALLNNRDHVRKEDLREMAYPVLRHRLILNFESERKGLTTDDVITSILKEV